MSDLWQFVRYNDQELILGQIYLRDVRRIGSEVASLGVMLIDFDGYMDDIRAQSVKEYASKYEIFLALYQKAKFAHKIMAEPKFQEVKQLATQANGGKLPSPAPIASHYQTDITLAYQFAGMMRHQYLEYLKSLKAFTQFLGTHQLRPQASPTNTIDPTVLLNKPFISRGDAILALGKSEDTIDRWCRSGKLVSKKDAGRGVLIATKEIRKILGYDK
jgi:hypothetical protein